MFTPFFAQRLNLFYNQVLLMQEKNICFLMLENMSRICLLSILQVLLQVWKNNFSLGFGGLK